MPGTVQKELQNKPVLPPNRLESYSEFCKAVKKDADADLILKSEVQWDMFRRTTKGLAKAHGLKNMLRPDYVPNNKVSMELFAKQQTFSYSALDQALQMDKGYQSSLTMKRTVMLRQCVQSSRST